MHKLFRCGFFIASLLVVISATAQPKQAGFKSFSIEDGLSHSSVYALTQDARGFVWVGTQGGLNRFDGYGFRVYRNEPSDPNSLSDDWVTALHLQRDTLWVGTYNKGINRVDTRTGKLSRLSTTGEHADLLKDAKIWSLAGDPQGNLWIGAVEGLFRLETGGVQDVSQSLKLQYWAHDENDPESLSFNEVDAIILDEGGVWVGAYGGGLNLLDLQRNRFTVWKNDPSNPQSLSNDKIKVMLRQDDGKIWIGTRSGLNLFDPQTETFQHFFTSEQGGKNFQISALALDSEGFLWVATRRNGVLVLNRETGEHINFRADPDDTESLNDNHVQSLYQDTSGMMWVATVKGLNTFSPFHHRFRMHGGRYDGGGGMGKRLIHSVLADWNENVWFGTHEGLYFYDTESDRYSVYSHDPNDSSSLSNSTVRAIYMDRQRRIWVGTGSGLDRYEPETDSFIHHQFKEGRENVSTIDQTRDGAMWVGTWGLGLYRLMENNGESDIRSMNFPPSQVSENDIRISSLLEDRFGYLWIGLEGSGICRTPSANPFDSELQEVLIADNSKPGSLVSNNVASIFEDSRGRVWVGAAGGLHRWNPETNRFVIYRLKDGLPNDRIMAIEEDEQLNIWLSTEFGLSRFNPETETFRNFDVNDGLQSNQFTRAVNRSPRGRLYFGGIEGVNSFVASEIFDNRYVPPVHFTKVMIGNRVYMPDTDVSSLRQVDLDYKDRAITIEFAGLDYTVPSKNRYAYSLSQSEDEWIELGSRNSVSLVNLPPRDYMLRVRASNHDRVWNMEGAAIRLSIKPPWWRTRWAYAAYILSVVFAFVLYLLAQRQKLARERFYARKLQQANEQLKMADRIKDEFLANTSHELRTPLNGMIGIADSLIDGAAGPVNDLQVENLSMVVSSGMRLANLVNDILDFSKMRRSTIELSHKTVDVNALAQVVVGLNTPLAQGKQIVLRNAINPELPPVWADESRLEQIMHNLVGNAVKFTEKGRVTITAQIDEAILWIRIIDTGVGIPPDKIDRIFESFEQVDGSSSRSHGGTGLGLAITKRLVELHGGLLKVESKEEEGSTFSFSLPLADAEQIEAAKNVEAPPSMRSEEEISAIIRLSDSPVSDPNDSSVENAEFRILLVDDEPVNLQVLRNFLTGRNYHLTQATHGEEALRLILESDNPFDLVLLDVMMPKMSGFEVCRKIREVFLSHELPVIMLTAKTQSGDIVTGFDAGANDYLVKPVSKSELLVRLRTHLDLLKASRNLKIINEKLEVYNRKLEQMVEDRTREISDRNQELEALDDIVQTINREVELDRVLNTLLVEALNLFAQAEKGSFLIKDRENGTFRFAAALGYELSEFADLSFSLRELRQRFNINGDSSKSMKVIHEGEFTQADAYLEVLPKPSASLVMTVFLDEQIEGFLILDNFSDAQAFDHSDLNKLNRLEAHAVSAVAKARILDEVRRKNEDLVLAQTQLILQEKMVYLGNLISGIAHEIQNPLNFVNNFSAVAKDLVDELTEMVDHHRKALGEEAYGAFVDLLTDMKENAGLIHDHGQRVTRIVRNMMMHSTTGKRERAPMAINDLLDEQFELTSHGFTSKGLLSGLEIEKQYDENAGMVDMVPPDMARALSNILKNAFDAMIEKESSSDDYIPRISLSSESHDKQVILKIRDNGVGIPEDHEDKIFTPFFTTKPTGKGVGLGLSISFDILVQGHSGHIHAETEPDRFTEFTITLPKSNSSQE